jgi:hypothetical protein
MHENLVNKLLQDYPKLFEHQKHIECNDGWYNLIDTWARQIAYYDDNRYLKYVKHPLYEGDETFIYHNITQIKEKFGTLRLYLNMSDDYVRGLTDLAEQLSGVTCEICGSPGQIRNLSWMMTLCDSHFILKSLGATNSVIEGKI